MSSPPIPPLLDHLVSRPFSFYPPILKIERNEWRYRKATWSEILVVNCKSGEEVWIPRRFVGDVSCVYDPVLIVGLTKELEYQEGAVRPFQRRVLQMPIAVGGTPPVAAHAARHERAPVVDIRLEPAGHRRVVRRVGGALAVVSALYVGTLTLAHVAEVRQRPGLDRSYFALAGGDDFQAVVRKLGMPERDQWLDGPDSARYQALSYPNRRFTVILRATGGGPATYVGTMDQRWRPLHSVELPSGGATGPLLRGLQRF